MTADDQVMLSEIIRYVDEHFDDPDEAPHVPYSVFKSMLERSRSLTDKQRQWVKGVHERLLEKPQYENLVSRGLVPRGREVPTPAVLQNLPKRPPQRRTEE